MLRDGTINDLNSGKKIKLKKYQKEHIEKNAYEFVESQPDDWMYKGRDKAYWLEYFKNNIPKVKRWSDYALYLINTQSTEWIRDNWIAKVKTSIRHWANTGSGIKEPIRDALLVLHHSVNKKFLEYKEDFTKGIWWDQIGFTDLSKMPIVKMFIYNEDSPENQVRYYIEQIINAIQNGDEEDKAEAYKELHDNLTLRTLLFGCKENENGEKEYGWLDNILEMPFSLRYIQEPWTSIEDLVNIPSGGDARMYILGGDYKKVKRVRNSCTEEELLKALSNGSRRYFRDDVRNSGSWKRACITFLRGDNSCTYMGFSPSAEQMAIRAEGIAAFSKSEEERKKALEEFEKMKAKAKIEKENNAKL